MRIKMFATDLDGTLLNSFHKMDKQIYQAINKAIQNGCYFVLASGRNFHTKAIRSFHLEDKQVYTVGCNGAIIKDSNGKIIFSKAIEKKYLKEIFELLDSQPFRIHYDDCCFITYNPNKRSLLGLFKFMFLKLIFQSKGNKSVEEILEREIFKMDIPIPGKKNRRIIDTYLDKRKSSLVDAKSFLETYEITDSSVNKAQGIQILMDIFNVQKEEVAVYGDSYNDIKMLKAFPNSYAPKNCNNVVKPYASKLIESNHFHGVSKHIIETINSNN